MLFAPKKIRKMPLVIVNMIICYEGNQLCYTGFSPIFSTINVVHNCSSTLYFLLQNYDTSESKLRREFESYGPIKSVSSRVVCVCLLNRFYVQLLQQMAQLLNISRTLV